MTFAPVQTCTADRTYHRGTKSILCRIQKTLASVRARRANEGGEVGNHVYQPDTAYWEGVHWTPVG